LQAARNRCERVKIMNRRGWTNDHDAQTGWRAPVTHPVIPNGYDDRSAHYARPPLQHGYPQPGAFGHARPGQPVAPQPPLHAPASYDLAGRSEPAPRRPATARYSEEPRAFGPQLGPGRPPHATNQAGLWWLRPRAQAYGGARYYPSPVTPNLAALDGQLRDLTNQIESLRERSPAPWIAHKHPQQSLDEIVAPLLQAVPLRAIETLDADLQALAERIESGRNSGVDPRALAPIEHGLGDVRAIIQQLKPVESLATFKEAIRGLAERLAQSHGGHYDGAAQTQVETVIGALRNIAALVASKETLSALSEEVRGLSARLQRVMAQNAGIPESREPVQPATETSSIERSLQDITLRLDALQKGAQPSGDRSPAAGFLNTDKSAQDALEVAHATLSQLVSQLAGSLKGARETKPDSAGHGSPVDRLSLSGAHSHAPGRLLDFANEHDPEFARNRMRNAVPHPLETADFEPETPSRSIVIPVRPLIFGALVIILAVVAARVSVQLTDIPLPSIAKADAFQASEPQGRTSAEAEVPDLVRSQKPDHAVSAPEQPVQQSALAIGERENSGVIGRPVPVAAGTGEATREPSMPLPGSLPAALRAEAMKGKPAAEYEVGVRLVEGKSAAVNTEEGLRWLKRAAKSGIIPAHLWIGSLYEKGLGVEKDLNLARTHYSAAAEKGNAKAMHNLAVLYAEGIDGRRDYKTAIRWFQRAAERGIADSQYNLAILLMRGIGIDQNHKDAYKWFALAALQGDREAARHRDEIGRKLEPGVVAAAQSAVQTFTPQPQPNEAVTVAAPAGGWDRASGESRKSESGIFARGASS
jgi:TPR repeat protein